MNRNFARKIFGMLMVIILAEITMGTNYYVRKSGNDNQNGTTPQTAWKTIAKAANFNLQPGDTVFIGKGTYNEQLIPTRSGTSQAPIVWYGDYQGKKTLDPPGRVAIGGCTDGIPVFVPQSAYQNGFTFYLVDIVKGTSTAEITIRLKNDNTNGVTYLAISLPPQTVALTPVNGSIYTSSLGIPYNVDNPTYNPFYSLKFRTASGDRLKLGATDEFKYTLPIDVVNNLTTITLAAKASWVTGTVTLPVIFAAPQAISYSTACTISGRSNLVLQGLTFECVSDKGVYIQNSSNIVVQDCDVRTSTNYGIYIGGYNNSGFIKMLSDSILCGANGGIYVSLSGDQTIYPELFIENNVITQCGYGIYAKYPKITNIVNNSIASCNKSGMFLTWIAEEIAAIAHNSITDCSEHGIRLERAKANLIANNAISGVLAHAIYVYNNSSSIYTIGAIRGNLISKVDNGSSGIYVDRIDCKDIVQNELSNISGDGIVFNANYGYYLNRIDSNVVANCSNRGIYITGATNLTSISENTVYGVSTGIYTTSGSYYTIDLIKGNRIFSYSDRGISCYRLQNSLFENNLIYNCTGSSSTTYGIFLSNWEDKTITIKNNTLYRAGYYGVYGFCVRGDWRNNIVTDSYYGFYGRNYSGVPVNITARYNCTYANDNDYTNITVGVGNIYEAPLFVDPDGADDILGGNNGADDDFHLKSSGGSWHFGQWLEDNEDSPCIDAGDPSDDYSLEPEDNGDRINIGCYGNTTQASKKPRKPITVIYRQFPGGKWVMLGVPVAPTEGNPPGDPMTIFGDDLGTTTPGDWYLIHWVTNDSTAEYFEYNDGTIYQPPTPYPGIGYFLWQGKYRSVDIDVRGLPVSRCQLEVAQQPNVDWYSSYGKMLGYNQFANPYEFTIDWSNAEIWLYPDRQWNDNLKQILSLKEAAEKGLISRYAYTWNHNLDQYEVIVPQTFSRSDTLSVWQGFYFIQVDSVSNLKLNIPRQTVLSKSNPMQQALAAKGTKYHFRSSSIAPEWQWFLKIGVTIPELNLNDTENGLGVTNNASVGFDGWDAFDLRGISSTGKYIQLEFVPAPGPTFAYDLRPDFSQSSTWKFRVNTSKTNLKKTGRLVWPHIRLVPENIKFSLLAGDSATVLCEDLRQLASYDYKITDSVMVFFIRAQKVSDTQAPQFKFVFHQNPLLPQDLTYYVIPSEPLSQITATVNGTPTSLGEIDAPPSVYYGKQLLTGNTTIQINVTGRDKANNTGTGMVSVQVALARANSLGKITEPAGGLTLTIPEGAVKNNTLICLARGALDIEPLPAAFAVGEPIYIGPEAIELQKPLLLHLDVDTLDEHCGLYRYENGQWQLVGPVQEMMPLPSTGLYQIFAGTVSLKEKSTLPHSYALEACYPNPFNNNIAIKYALPNFSHVEIRIYDLLGREVCQLMDQFQPAGYHQVNWDGTNAAGASVATGIYYLQMVTKNDGKPLFKATQKITLIK